MKLEQEHNGTGDNIGGDKYELNYNYPTSFSDIQSKLIQRKTQSKLRKEDIGDSDLLEILKEVVSDIIEEEQRKSHQIVPLGTIKSRFKSLFDEEVFVSIIRALTEEGIIRLENAQVCFLERQVNYKINL